MNVQRGHLYTTLSTSYDISNNNNNWMIILKNQTLIKNIFDFNLFSYFFNILDIKYFLYNNFGKIIH